MNSVQTYIDPALIEPVRSFYLDLRGFGNCETRIKINLFKYEEFHIVVLQDLGKGTSVTNMSEMMATEVFKQTPELVLEKTSWLECYPYYKDWDFDIISYTFDPSQNKLTSPNWSPVNNPALVNRLKELITPEDLREDG